MLPNRDFVNESVLVLVWVLVLVMWFPGETFGAFGLPTP